MSNEESRLSVLEAQMKEIKEEIGRYRTHISSLLTFKNNIEGALKLSTFILGFIGFSGLLQIGLSLWLITKPH